MRKELASAITALAQLICPHDWKKIGKRWADVRHECKVCGAIGWQYKEDVPYEDHLVSRIECEAGIPDYAGRVLVALDTDMRKATSYDWTEDDTIGFAQTLAFKRNRVIVDNKAGKLPPSAVEMLEQTFMDFVLPKLSEEADYRLAKSTFNQLTRRSE